MHRLRHYIYLFKLIKKKIEIKMDIMIYVIQKHKERDDERIK